MKAIRLLAFASLILGSVVLMAQGNSATLYGTGNKGTELVTIDLASQQALVLGPTGYSWSLTLAFSPTGTAYTMTRMSSAGVAQLVTLDLSDGGATLVGAPVNPTLNLQIMGMIFSPQGVLYAGAMPATTIYSVDTTTGLAGLPPVGSSATSGELMSFAYNPEGTLYAASPTALYTVDLATGQATLVHTFTNVAGVMGIAFDEDGVLYATNFVGCPPCSSVYQVDPTTAEAAAVFNTGIPFIHNIAFNPGSAADQLAALENHVNRLGLLGGIAVSLNAKLSAALNAVNAGDNATACNIFGAFQNQVSALSGQVISLQQLTFATMRLNTALGCN